MISPEPASPKLQKALCSCFSIGEHRTPHQDVLYSLQQMVEIAAHAMSPGINEPYTALTCIDWLGASLLALAKRDFPLPLRHDEDGKLRVVAVDLDFEEIARASFDQIRIYGATNPDVMLRLLDIIAEIAPDLRRERDRSTLRTHARLIGDDARQIVNKEDHERVEARLHQALHALNSND